MMSEDIRARLSEPQSAWHDGLLRYGTARIDAAERRWSQRHGRWRESEQLYRAYRVPDEQDRRTRRQSMTEGLQKIVVPYSYATVQSMLAFEMAVLTERIPLVPVRGDGPADVVPAMLMEDVLYYQMQRMEPAWVTVLFQWRLDAHRYGLGVVKNIHTVREWVDLVRVFGTVVDPLTGIPMPTDDISEQDVVAYEGNEAMNVIPYDFLPDPQRPISEFQRGEFCGHRMRRSETELSQRAAEGLYAGVEHIKESSRRAEYGGSTYAGPGASDLARIADMDSYDDEQGGTETVDRKPYVTIHELWCWMAPRDLERYGLRTQPTTTPKLWVLTIANRARVLRAEPANLPGHRFPFEICEPNYDCHSPANFSTIEMVKDLNRHLDFLFNSRMAAVRKTLNNELVYDPAMVEQADMDDPQPGKLIRLTRQYQGSGVPENAVVPLKMQDVTQGHHQDAQVVRQIAEEVTAASRNLMGLPNTGRRSASEVQGTMAMSSGRAKMGLELFCSQGYRPLIHQMVRNTQTFMANSLNLRMQEQYARVVGADVVEVWPQMLQGNFSYPILEGGIPSDKAMEQQVWRELLTSGIQSGVATPLLQSINWMQVMVAFLRSVGVRNFKDFIGPAPQMQVMPDAQVQAQAQQGNLVPSAMPSASSDGFPMGPAGPMTGNNGLTMPL